MCAADACAFLRLCDAETGRLTPEDPEHWPSVRLERRPQGGSRPLLRVRGPGVRAHLAGHRATRSVVRFLTRSQGRKRGRKEPGRERGQSAGPRRSAGQAASLSPPSVRARHTQRRKRGDDVFTAGAADPGSASRGSRQPFGGRGCCTARGRPGESARVWIGALPARFFAKPPLSPDGSRGREAGQMRPREAGRLVPNVGL